MSCINFDDLTYHTGHKIEVVGYTDEDKKEIINTAIECRDCNEVLLDFDRDESLNENE